jgi:hypothetical protein
MALLTPDPRSTILGATGAQALGKAAAGAAGFASNPAAALGRTVGMVKSTAAARISNMVAQKLSPTSIRRIQQLLQLTDFAAGLGGEGDIQDIEQPLLGGMTLRDARETYEQLRDAQLARRNLFYIRVIDYNPPPVEYADGAYFTSLFNLFAVDVSYAPSTLTGEKVPLGSQSLDRLTGSEAVDLSITTMDDSRGSLKRWFDGKVAQAAHSDGTFGLPSEYWVDIECYHATPQAREDAYKINLRMRPQNTQHDLSRRDQAMSEVVMTFTQADTFLKP